MMNDKIRAALNSKFQRTPILCWETIGTTAKTVEVGDSFRRKTYLEKRSLSGSAGIQQEKQELTGIVSLQRSNNFINEQRIDCV